MFPRRFYPPTYFPVRFFPDAPAGGGGGGGSSGSLAPLKIPLYADVLDDDQAHISRAWLNYFQSLGNQIVAGAVNTVSGTANRITVTPGVNPIVDIDSAYIGQTSLTTLGTVATGTWQATPIATAYIAGHAVTNPKLAQMPTLTLKGNDTLGTADAKDLTVSETLALLGLGSAITGAGTANNVTMFTGSHAIGNAPGLTYDPSEGGIYNFANLVNVAGTLSANEISVSTDITAGSMVVIGALTAGSYSSTSLSGTGTRLVTSTAGGTLGNTTTIAGSYVFGGTLAASNLSGTNTGDQTITLTGDVTGSGTGSFAATIGANKVTLAKMAQVATSIILGRLTAGTGNVEALSASGARTVLGLATTDSPTFAGATFTGTVLLGGKITSNLTYLSALYNAEASSTPYYQANDGGTVNIRLSPSGAANPYNWFKLNTVIGGTDTAPGVNSNITLGGNFGTLTFGTAAAESGPYKINTIGSGSATPATKGTGYGRDLIISAGDSDNTAGKAGGDLYIRPGAPTAPATAYGVVRIADLGGTVAIGGAASVAGEATLSAALTNNITNVSADTTLSATQHTVYVYAGSANRIITLPLASTCTGRVYIIRKSDGSANTVTVTVQGADSIEDVFSVVLGGTSALGRLVVRSGGGNYWAIEELYDEGFFTGTLTGVSPSVTGTIRWVRNGRQVTMMLPQMLGTSNSTSCTITGASSVIWPNRIIAFPGVTVIDNSASVFGAGSGLRISTAGVITLYPNGTTTGFTAAGVKGFFADVDGSGSTATQPFSYTLL